MIIVPFNLSSSYCTHVCHPRDSVLKSTYWFGLTDTITCQMNHFQQLRFNSLKQRTKMPCWVTVLLKIIPPEFIVLLNTCFSILVTIRTRVDQPVGGFTCWVPVSVFLVNELTKLLAEFPFQSSLAEKCLLIAYFSCQLSRCLAECPFQHAKRIFLYSCLAECPFKSRSFKRRACRQHISVA